jgi:hypothetical protein
MVVIISNSIEGSKLTPRVRFALRGKVSPLWLKTSSLSLDVGCESGEFALVRPLERRVG